MNARAIRAVAVASALTFVLTACGQKPGVHVEGGVAAGNQTGQGGGPLDVNNQSGGTGDGTSGSAGGTTGGTSTGATAAGGASTAGSGSTGGSGGGSTGASTGGTTGGSGGGDAAGGTGGGDTTGSGSSGGSAGGQEGDQPQGTQQPQGSDRTGAEPDSGKLVFGLHAPVTGAAPLPTPSFEQSGDLYWKYVIEDLGESVLGRDTVQLIFRDDKYSPDSARQVCRELASKAFALAGGGGTDQIQACGLLAERGKFPYFSAGVTEAGLEQNPWYFASSMTYRQQGMLLANMVAKNPYGDPKIGGNGKIAMIVTDTPNFDDAVQGWEQGLQQFGLADRYYKTYKHPKGDSSWYDSIASEFKSAGVEVVYILSSPVDYIDFSQRANDTYSYNPRYIGVGVSMGLNAVLGAGCGDPGTRADQGIFFSPFPGLDWARNNVPQFFEAGQKRNVPTDDIAFALWGSNAVNHQLLLRYQQVFGNDLTREDFRAVVEQQTGVQTGVFPELNYSPDNHFGAGEVHVLQADCSTKQYKTLGTFVSGF